MKPYLFLFAFCLLGFQTTEVNAQRKKNKKQAQVSFTEDYYNAMEWRLVGPFRGGRAGTVTEEV